MEGATKRSNPRNVSQMLKLWISCVSAVKLHSETIIKVKQELEAIEGVKGLCQVIAEVKQHVERAAKVTVAFG